MKRNIHFLLSCLSLLLILAACTASPAAPAAQTPVSTQAPPAPSTETAAAEPSAQISITDALGREVVLEAPPRRIVVTGKALIMVLDAVYTFPQAPERIAAIGDAAQGSTNFIALIDPEYQAKAIFTQDASPEQIAAVRPDLVILKSILAETTGKALQAIDIPVVYVDFENPEQYTRDLQVLGQVFQDEARALQLVGYYQSRVNAVQAALEGETAKPRTLLLYHNEQGGTVSFNVPPMSWMQTRMVELAGGEPVWAAANPGKGWTKVSLEQIAAWDPDHIYIVSYTKNAADVAAALKTDPQWLALRAPQQGHLYAFPSDLYSWDQPDVRWALGLTWLAGRLHPDRFSSLDIVQEAQNFYQVLYGLDQTFFDQNIRPNLKGDIQ